MRKAATDALGDILLRNGEVLPLETDDDIELFILNVQVIDALDEAKSTIWRFPSSNRIMRITKTVFIPSVVRDVDMFRLPHRASATYVSERFVERVHSAGLCGLTFNEVWP
jgi:hypothetical protein